MRGKIKKVLFLSQECSLEQRPRNARDQNEQISPTYNSQLEPRILAKWF